MLIGILCFSLSVGLSKRFATTVYKADKNILVTACLCLSVCLSVSFFVGLPVFLSDSLSFFRLSVSRKILFPEYKNCRLYIKCFNNRSVLHYVNMHKIGTWLQDNVKCFLPTWQNSLIYMFVPRMTKQKPRECTDFPLPQIRYVVITT